AILSELPRDSEYVFPGRNGPLYKNAMRIVLRSIRKDCTVHGFRSTFRDWAAEATTYANHVVEMALAHKVKGVEGDYRRDDLLPKRVPLMNDWARYCTTPQRDATVTSIRARVD